MYIWCADLLGKAFSIEDMKSIMCGIKFGCVRTSSVTNLQRYGERKMKQRQREKENVCVCKERGGKKRDKEGKLKERREGERWKNEGENVQEWDEKCWTHWQSSLPLEVWRG